MVRQAIKKAFKELRKQGIYARMDYKDCQSCGTAAIPGDAPNDAVGYAFFHHQDNRTLENKGFTHIAFGSLDDDVLTSEVGRKVADILSKYTNHVYWNGSGDERIRVGPYRSEFSHKVATQVVELEMDEPSAFAVSEIQFAEGERDEAIQRAENIVGNYDGYTGYSIHPLDPWR